MELKVPFLADRQLESAATELLRKYAKWKGTPPRPPIPVDDIVEGLLELSLSIGDLRTRLGKNDVLGATWLDDGHVMIDSSLEGNEGRFSFTLAHETPKIGKSGKRFLNPSLPYCETRPPNETLPSHHHRPGRMRA